MNKMRDLRTERGISMREAASSLEMPYTTYVNYEKGLREPNSETLIQIANYYNCSIDYLLGRSDDRITEEVLDIVNSIDDDLLRRYGNIYDALKAQGDRDAKEFASPTHKGAEEATYEQILSSLTSMLEELGWIREDSDITDEDRRFLLAVAAMLQTYFEKGNS